MIKLTRGDFERELEKKNQTEAADMKRAEQCGKAGVYILVPAFGIIMLFVPVGFGWKLLYSFITAVAVLLIFLVLPMLVILFRGLKEISPGVITKLKFIRKYKEYYERLKNDLCSDEILELTERHLEKEKSDFGRIALLEEKMDIHLRKCRFEQAYDVLEELMKMSAQAERCGINVCRYELSYYGAAENNEKYIGTMEANQDELLKMAALGGLRMCETASLLSVYEFSKGNYEQALEYSILSDEYREKFKISEKKANMKNNELCSKAAFQSMRGRIYICLEEFQKAKECLECAEENIASMTCEIPELIKREIRDSWCQIELIDAQQQ